MFELIEKAFLLGLGAVSMSQKKAEDLLQEMKEKYKMSEEEGRAFLDKLQTLARDSRMNLSQTIDAEVEKSIKRLGLVSRDEFDALQKRVRELESASREAEQVKVYPV